MATGTIKILLLNQPPKEEKVKIKLATSNNNPPVQRPVIPPPPPPQPQPPVAPHIEEINADFTPKIGVDDVSVAVVAPNKIMAKDYVCSTYYDFIALTGNSSLSVYARNHETIRMITETKRCLDRISSRPVGSKIDFAFDSSVLADYTLVLGMSGRQEHSLNLHISCLSYSEISQAVSADIVLVIVNCADADITSEKVASLASSVGSKSVSWVLTGFVRENPFYESDFDTPPESTVIGMLKNKINIPLKASDSVCYAQQYGCFVVEESKNSEPVYTTNSRCREYTPVACSLPIAYALVDFNKNCDVNRFTLRQICDMLDNHLNSGIKVNPAWREKA